MVVSLILVIIVDVLFFMMIVRVIKKRRAKKNATKKGDRTVQSPSAHTAVKKASSNPFRAKQVSSREPLRQRRG